MSTTTTIVDKKKYDKANPYLASNGTKYWVEANPRKGERLFYVKGDNLPRATSYVIAVGMEDGVDGFSMDTLTSVASLERVKDFVEKHGLSQSLLEHISTRTAFWRAQKNEVEATRWAAYGVELRAEVSV